ncbi:MAG: recombinase family protein [Eubacteriales bacterium]|nr:recombinase family protein [Eubacteriales bacterium]
MRYVSYIKEGSCFFFGEEKQEMGRQREEISAYAKRHGFKIQEEYMDCAEMQAKTGFQSLVADGIRREFDGVILSSVFRCGSSLWEAKEILLETFQYAGIFFIVTEDDFDSREAGNQGAETYFKEKYREYKSRAFSCQNKAGRKKVEKTKTMERNVLENMIYEKKTGKRWREKDWPQLSEKISLEKEMMEAMKAEKRLADKIKISLQKGLGEAYIKEAKEQQLPELKKIFLSMAEEEFVEREWYRQYERRELTWEEYGRKREEQKERLLKKDILFQQAVEKFEKMAKAFSEKNPWIVLMEEWDREYEKEEGRGNKADVKRYIKKIWVGDNFSIRVETKKEEWKAMFPKEWLS